MDTSARSANFFQAVLLSVKRIMDRVQSDSMGKWVQLGSCSQEVMRKELAEFAQFSQSPKFAWLRIQFTLVNTKSAFICKH